jgi:hypothetical protein
MNYVYLRDGERTEKKDGWWGLGVGGDNENDISLSLLPY